MTSLPICCIVSNLCVHTTVMCERRKINEKIAFAFAFAFALIQMNHHLICVDFLVHVTRARFVHTQPKRIIMVIVWIDRVTSGWITRTCASRKKFFQGRFNSIRWLGKRTDFHAMSRWCKWIPYSRVRVRVLELSSGKGRVRLPTTSDKEIRCQQKMENWVSHLWQGNRRWPSPNPVRKLKLNLV